jgi:L-lactate dehydrogenase complex protein LldE
MADNAAAGKSARPRFQVALFATCLADLFRPSVVFASIRLLEDAGCEVHVPAAQTCCGQPGYNTGDYESTAPLARQVIAMLEPWQYVVLPSGSCAGMITQHYPRLLEGEWHQRALDLAAKTYELTSFLHDVAGVRREGGSKSKTSVTYHDSCAGLRELGIRRQPRQLLQALSGITVTEMDQTDVCCGFGGTFCAKMPELSAKMASDKLANAERTGAQILAGGDLGCLLSLAGRARREGRDIEFRHVAELLAGDLATPAIGRAEDS